MAKILMSTTDVTDRSVIRQMFAATDKNQDGKITFLEFAKMMNDE